MSHAERPLERGGAKVPPRFFIGFRIFLKDLRCFISISEIALPSHQV